MGISHSAPRPTSRPTFPKFTQLPLELQNKIWSYIFIDSALHPDRVSIGNENLAWTQSIIGWPQELLSAPAIFSVNKHSRREAIHLASSTPYLFANPWPLFNCLVFDAGTHFIECRYAPSPVSWSAPPEIEIPPHSCANCNDLLESLRAKNGSAEGSVGLNGRRYSESNLHTTRYPLRLDTLAEYMSECVLHSRAKPPWIKKKHWAIVGGV